MKVRFALLGLFALLLLAACGASPRVASPQIVVHPHNRPVHLGGPPPANPAVGDVLTAGSGQWSGSPTGFAYQWKDCDSNGANCTNAAGTPSNTNRYVVDTGDQGFRIRVAVTAHYSGHPDSTVLSQPTSAVGDGTFPLSVASSGRTLQTSSGTPFLIVGDSPQSTIGNLSVTNAEAYLDDRASHGFNAVWFNLLCGDYTFCNTNGTAVGDGGGAIAPFTSGTTPTTYNFGTPTCANCNSAYFSRAHTIVAYAKTKGIVVFLDPAETGVNNQNGGTDCTTTTNGDGERWTTAMTRNGDGTVSTSDADYQYGQYLGNTFGDLSNIIWMSGNDFQCLGSSAANNNAKSIANGIRNTDSSALQTVEPDYCSSFGFNCEGSSSITAATGSSTGWSSNVDLNAAYTYAAAYGEVGVAYGQSSTKPAFLVESNYDGEALAQTDGCSTVRNCRLQEWWTMTSGGAGNLYGCHCTTQLTNANFPNSMDTTGVTQLGYETTLLNSIAWQNLVPDSNGAGHLVTSGGGTCPTTGSFVSVTCVTASIDSGGHLALIFDPQGNSLTVDMTKMAGSTTARWYDPANGSFTTATGSPISNSGSHTFSVPSANNSAGTGNPDWVLLLQA